MVKATLFVETVFASASSSNWPAWVKTRPLNVANPFALVTRTGGAANRPAPLQPD